jgi:uncharacterized ion transporter superfamily protein YfcC
MSFQWFEKLKVPHVYTLLTGIILFGVFLSYIVPSGEFIREEKELNGLKRTMVVPGTFQEIEKHYSIPGIFVETKEEGKASPVSFLQFLSAIPRGMEGTADIIFFIFILGGVFSVIQRTGTITAVIQALVRKYSGSDTWLTILLMVLIAIAGSTLGMGEEFIPLFPLFIYLAREMGYDRIYGIGLVILAADVGFAAATTNPFTVQIAQGIAEVPIGSGIGFRMIFFVIILITAIIYLYRYGRKIKKDPTKSLMYGVKVDNSSLSFEKLNLTKRHKFIVYATVLIFILIIFCMQTMNWWLAEMAGGFLLMAVIAAWIGKLSPQETAEAFVSGTKEMAVAALVVGFAKGIQVVLADGMIMDTLIHFAASSIEGMPKIIAAEGMFVFQTFLNFFIPSGSGQAATTMPLMAPLSDLLGITRQTAVFAFTCGDGFSNTIIPTSGVLMAVLSLGGVPYEKWIRFMLPLFLILSTLAAIFLAIAVLISY